MRLILILIVLSFLPSLCYAQMNGSVSFGIELWRGELTRTEKDWHIGVETGMTTEGIPTNTAYYQYRLSYEWPDLFIAYNDIYGPIVGLGVFCEELIMKFALDFKRTYISFGYPFYDNFSISLSGLRIESDNSWESETHTVLSLGYFY